MKPACRMAALVCASALLLTVGSAYGQTSCDKKCTDKKAECGEQVAVVVVEDDEDGQVECKVKIIAEHEPDDDAREIKIMCRIEDDKETVRIWIDGKEVDADSMEDIEKILKKHGLDCSTIHMNMDMDDLCKETDKCQIITKSHGIELCPDGHTKENCEGDCEQTLQFQLKGDDCEGHGKLRMFDPNGNMGILMQDGDKMIRMFDPNGDMGELMHAIEPPKAMLGIMMEPVPDVLREYLKLDEGSGLLVSEVLEGTAAEESGLEADDIIVAIGMGKKGWIHPINEESLRDFIAEREIGDKVGVKVLRAGKSKVLWAKLKAWSGGSMGFGMPMFEGEDFDIELALPEGMELPEGLFKEGQPQMHFFRGEDGAEGLIELRLTDELKLPEGFLKELQGKCDSERDDTCEDEHHPRLRFFDEDGEHEGRIELFVQPDDSFHPKMKLHRMDPPKMFEDDHLEEMMKMMEQQMRALEEMIEQLHKQQDQLRKELKEAKSRDA